MKLEIQENEVKNNFQVSLDMYDVPENNGFLLSNLSDMCQERILYYKKMDRYLETHRDKEEKDKNFYGGLQDLMMNHQSKVFQNQKNDLASHWMLKLTFINFDIGKFVMRENFIFGTKLQIQSQQWAFKEAEKWGLDKEYLLKNGKVMNRITRQYFFDFLADFLKLDSQDEKIFTGKLRKLQEDEVESEFTNQIRRLDQRRIRIPFRFCGRLLEKYEVQLDKGMVLVGPLNAFIVIQEIFQEILFHHNKQVQTIFHKMINSDERITKLIKILQDYNQSAQHFIKTNTNFKNKELTIESIDAIAEKHFPLCMLEIFKSLRKKHKLKHWGRIQLGIFLKAAGMKLKDSLSLFLNELKKTSEGSKKINEYKYYIEHNYGKRGKKMDYDPWSCKKVQGRAIPPKGESYGCPYSFYSDDILGEVLAMKGLDNEQIRLVNKLRKDQYYLGCRKVYQITHGGIKPRKGVGKHPNYYYLSSYYYYKRNQKKTTQISNLS